ncbi:type IV pilin N-terminal domain-containing protein [Methanolapillus africanus]|uniref:type IV pilin N-terminal domain-containing protein n=1 Tax=Methanolapillus africanus TaxID=3028297 RepID=UPI0030B8A2D2
MPNFLRDKRGISPVVGVLMLLAITVIMAGYLGSEVLSYEFEKPAPPVSMSARYEKADVGTTSYGVVRLEHIGGASLDVSNLKILAGSTEVNLSNLKKESIGIGESVAIANIGSSQVAVLEYPVSKSSKKPAGNLIVQGESLEITVIDVSHNQILYKATVRNY